MHELNAKLRSGQITEEERVEIRRLGAESASILKEQRKLIEWHAEVNDRQIEKLKALTHYPPAHRTITIRGSALI